MTMAKRGCRLLVALLLWAPVAGLASAAGEEGFPPWRGREESLEDALLRGRVVDLQPVGHGVTRPWRAELELEGARLSAVWKPIDSSVQRTIKESYQAEVAVYRLSRLLGLDRVPPTVARQIDRKGGSLQYWVEDCRLFAEVKEETPGSLAWTREMARMRFFDLLIDNPDRNANNFLVDEEWRIVLIDHSRALAFDAYTATKRKPPPVHFDRQLVKRLKALELEDLKRALAGVLPRYRMRAILKQRKRLLRHVEQTVAERGEGVYF